MQEGLAAIDVSAIAELVRIKGEEDILRERLARMDSSREKVSAVVYKRVRTDYETRATALDAESRPLKERARREYAKLKNVRRDVERSVEEASLEKEELEFRRDLGEFPGDQFKQRLKECEARLAERRKELEEVDKLKEQFLGAFHSAEELEAPASAAPAGRQTPPVGGETLIARLPQPAAPQQASGTCSSDVTQLWTPPLARPAAAPGSMAKQAAAAVTSTGATVAMSLSRLVHVTEGKPDEEFVLRPATISIGRAPQSDIHLPQSAVSRHHANIVFGPEGYKIVDMGSPNGILVNGQRVKEHILADGDVVQVGIEKLIYKA